jgi:transcriptional regulator with XRE-family HTH domain
MENPITEFRKEYRYTQRFIAGYAGITEQVVLKAEQGLYPTLPPSLLRAVSHLQGVTESSFEERYENWINESLAAVKLPSVGDHMVTNRVTFVEWRSTVCGMNHVPDNINAFCKLMKIHPYVIQKYESGKMKGVPIQLIQRIGQIKGIG